jgi:hypothetical protein
MVPYHWYTWYQWNSNNTCCCNIQVVTSTADTSVKKRITPKRENNGIHLCTSLSVACTRNTPRVESRYG